MNAFSSLIIFLRLSERRRREVLYTCLSRSSMQDEHLQVQGVFDLHWADCPLRQSARLPARRRRAAVSAREQCERGGRCFGPKCMGISQATEVNVDSRITFDLLLEVTICWGGGVLRKDWALSNLRPFSGYWTMSCVCFLQTILSCLHTLNDEGEIQVYECK